MKILFLSDNFPPQSFGGAGIVAYRLAQALKKQGHDIFVITTVQEKNRQGEEEANGLKIFRIYADYHPRWQAWLSLYNPQTAARVKEIIQIVKPDVVHAHNLHYYLSYHCLKIANQFSRAVFLTAHDLMLVHYGKLMPKDGRVDYRLTFKDHWAAAGKRYNPFRNLAIRRYLRYADKIFAVSRALQKTLRINRIKNVEVVFNGIDINERPVEPFAIDEFKQKFGLVGKQVILFAGRPSGAKGRDVILLALAKVIESAPRAVLLVAGKIDDYNQKMMEQTIGKSAPDLNRHLVLTGWLDSQEMKTALATADVCVVPSVAMDCFPTIVLEAMAGQKPVVGTCFGGANEMIIDGETGYTVDPNNIELLAEKIIDLLKSPTKAKEFGRHGYERVRQLFSLDQQVKDLLKWYGRFLKSE
ncbi:MAG: glycosyltransferase family 4 protein [bacterium]